MTTALRSLRFARYSAQELAAASESLLFGTVGDIDHGSRANGLRAGGVEQVSRNLVQLPQKQRLLEARVDTKVAP